MSLREYTRIFLGAAATLLLAADPGSAQAPPAAPAAALPPPSPLQEAFAKAAGDVLDKATVPVGARVDLLIDPLIDGNTGAQSSATRTMEGQLRKLVSEKYATKFQVKPFTQENLASNPFVFIGTFTPIHAKPNATGAKDAYRICFAILDMKSKLISSKGFARATTLGINPVPTPAFLESPVWVKDPSIDGYVRTCQGTKAGDPINATYLERIVVASQIAEAISAYDQRQYSRALELFSKARSLPGGDQLRVHNGVYLSNLKLGRTADAEKSLSQLFNYGMQGERLGVLMLFTKGTTSFVTQPISRVYPAWLKAIADKATAQKSCLEVIGHASQTGTEAFNDTLSAARAQAVSARLSRMSPTLAATLKSSGKGWHENLIGTGRDDQTDALDRRVEFKVGKCV